MQNSLNESQVVMNEIVRTCAENGISEAGLNIALMSMIHTSMKAAYKDEHNLCDENGVLMLNVKRYT